LAADSVETILKYSSRSIMLTVTTFSLTYVLGLCCGTLQRHARRPIRLPDAGSTPRERTRHLYRSFLFSLGRPLSRSAQRLTASGRGCCFAFTFLVILISDHHAALD